MKVLLHCADVVGPAMAGPAIRYWEMATALSQHFQVTLSPPNNTTLTHEAFRIVPFNKERPIVDLAAEHDFLITQYINPVKALTLKHTKVILDLYDPVPLEALEINKTDPLKQRIYKNNHYVNRINLCTKIADGYLCANEQQFQFWAGLLMGQFCITPERYDHSQTFRDYLSIVPFGLPSTPPVRKGEGLRKKYNLRPDDKVILWGGGIWNWFDPLTLIRAMHLLSKSRPDIKLVFMGLKHPNDTIPAMSMSLEAIRLAEELQLTDTQVFFNYEWVPYEERTGFLLDADIGTSIHSQHLETVFAFRTRILDYLWADLPILATTGDSFADLISRHELGVVVPYNDPQAVADGILRLLNDKEFVARVKANIREIKQEFVWDKVTLPVVDMIRSLSTKESRRLSLADKTALFFSFVRSFGNLMAANR